MAEPMEVTPVSHRIAVLVIAAACLAGCTPATTYVSAQSVPPEHTITVSGTARVELVPDEACVELTLAARDASMLEAHARLTQGHQALVAELRQNGALAVENGAIQYAPEYETDATGRSHLARHLATAQVNVRTKDFARIPEVVGRAANYGLERVEVVYYSTTIVDRRAEVRGKALAAARDKAQAMATALDASLAEVVEISEGDTRTNARIEVSNYLERANADAAPDQPPKPGAIPLSMTVNVVYRLR